VKLETAGEGGLNLVPLVGLHRGPEVSSKSEASILFLGEPA